jgi:hypothetical protein
MQRIKYIIVALVSFALGLAILTVHGGFVRGYLGDVVVVIFLYALIKSVVDAAPAKLALIVFALAAVPEIMQYFHAADRLALTGIARTTVGTLFDPYDFMAYVAGVLIIYTLDVMVLSRRPRVRVSR